MIKSVSFSFHDACVHQPVMQQHINRELKKTAKCDPANNTTTPPNPSATTTTERRYQRSLKVGSASSHNRQPNEQAILLVATSCSLYLIVYYPALFQYEYGPTTTITPDSRSRSGARARSSHHIHGGGTVFTAGSNYCSARR